MRRAAGPAGEKGGRAAPRLVRRACSRTESIDFMSAANESVTYRIQEGGSYEWIVDEATKLLGRYRIVRIDAGLELDYECECGRSDQRGSMCRHILACIKEARVRRNLLKEGGIGTKWITEK